MELEVLTNIAQTGAVGIALVLLWILWKMHTSFLNYLKTSDERHDNMNQKQEEILRGFSANITELNHEVKASHNEIKNGVAELKNLISAK